MLRCTAVQMVGPKRSHVSANLITYRFVGRQNDNEAIEKFKNEIIFFGCRCDRIPNKQQWHLYPIWKSIMSFQKNDLINLLKFMLHFHSSLFALSFDEFQHNRGANIIVSACKSSLCIERAHGQTVSFNVILPHNTIYMGLSTFKWRCVTKFCFLCRLIVCQSLVINNYFKFFA